MSPRTNEVESQADSVLCKKLEEAGLPADYAVDWFVFDDFIVQAQYDSFSETVNYVASGRNVDWSVDNATEAVQRIKKSLAG